jgi:hypothetical protein
MVATSRLVYRLTAGKRTSLYVNKRTWYTWVETRVSVGDLAVEVPSWSLEGPGSGFFVSMRGGGLGVADGGLPRFCNWCSTHGECMVLSENDHLAGRDIYPRRFLG